MDNFSHQKSADDWITKELGNFRLALNESTIISVTDPKGKIIFVNDKFCEISKYPKEELIGKDHRIVNSGYHPKEFMRDLWQTIKRGEVWRGEVRNKAKDGSFYWVNATIVPFFDDQNRLYQYVAIRHDITQRKEIQEQIMSLSAKIIQAQEEERRFIAQEIHDDFGQLLIALKLFIVNNTTDLIAKYPELKILTETINNRVGQITEKARNLSHQLAPPNLKYIGLVKAINEMLLAGKQQFGFQVEFKHRNLKGVIFEGKEILVYRVIQEALNNVIKHANAKNVVIQLYCRGNKVILTVTDDGMGFDPRAKIKSSKSIGLSLMRERAKLAGGSLKIHSSHNSGTEIHMDFPVERAVAAKEKVIG